MEPVMAGRITISNVQLDAPTSRAVADGIGERLRQALGAEPPVSDRLQKLLDEMRQREARDNSKENSH
ncbi:hypothetical protein [Bradyrhizobium sp. LHD-71]|uniref:hypothetical protein n=1 Tax=Bradyrhizobium sp. LHD-71 TaxID=3072141 RepID=UPI00280D7C63|nr:hypothetical protein [Bradyrhizobium sp. LHD-71]MDQ8729894.1 hypothetical protein [Bradyrhizobium sp. LHD-71]